MIGAVATFLFASVSLGFALFVGRFIQAGKARQTRD